MNKASYKQILTYGQKHFSDSFLIYRVAVLQCAGQDGEISLDDYVELSKFAREVEA